MEDVTCIAAPRPLRLFSYHHPQLPPVSRRVLSTPVEAFARFNLRDDDAVPSTSSSVSDSSQPLPQSPSPVSSPEALTNIEFTPSIPRPTALSLPDNETLEEFFAILRPQVLSPPLRFRRHHHFHHPSVGGAASTSLPRAHPYRVNKKSHSSTVSEDSDRRSRRGVGTAKRSSTGTSATGSEVETTTPLTSSFESEPQFFLELPTPENNFELGSPISRTHTRNPLPRHPSYEALTSMLILSPPPRPSNNPIDSSTRI